MKTKDKIFKDPLYNIVDFEFDNKVANVFEDMLKRSIPGYSSIIATVGMLTKLYSQPNSNYYDLGSSLGASALAMRRNVVHPNCRVIAIDNSEAMVNRSKDIIGMDNSETPIDIFCDDIRNFKIENAAVVVLNYTLQFISPKNRDKIIQNIYDGMKSGGILILSEKIIFEDTELNERQISRYHNFKRLNGYSDIEISKKKEALENVLIPDTVEIHKKRLLNAGFKTADVWHQTFNFVSIVAEK
ncbi:MAG: carboxy-S-adenosyl-L-methionine synthase CmoA [Ignavibacteriales bacterium CG18_big_fil_WC_8_21_14_2_50_31_20]|nr:MAG: carboxy-S-adenosyl-L-methionine synthase CmoA [Ignavibacteriales bacterium CG18_big_fil_WC_8_21_14_2_50_31_20]